MLNYAKYVYINVSHFGVNDNNVNQATRMFMYIYYHVTFMS